MDVTLYCYNYILYTTSHLIYKVGTYLVWRAARLVLTILKQSRSSHFARTSPSSQSFKPVRQSSCWYPQKQFSVPIDPLFFKVHIKHHHLLNLFFQWLQCGEGQHFFSLVHYGKPSQSTCCLNITYTSIGWNASNNNSALHDVLCSVLRRTFRDCYYRWNNLMLNRV